MAEKQIYDQHQDKLNFDHLTIFQVCILLLLENASPLLTYIDDKIKVKSRNRKK